MDFSQRLNFIQQFPIFRALSTEQHEQIARSLQFQVIKRHQFIYLPDEASHEVFFLVKGAVKVGTISMDGKEVIKSLIHPEAMFGELGLIGEASRQDFAKALKEDVHLLTWSVRDAKAMMESSKELANSFLTQFGSRLLRAERKLESLIFQDARTRIIEFIKNSIQERGRQIGYEMLLKHSLTHQDIANITCTSRQTVTLVLNELKKSDLIYFNRGRILVRDMAKLA